MKNEHMLVRGIFPGDTKARDIEVGGKGRIENIKPSGKREPHYGSDTAIILPTLFDIQVNGAGGIDLAKADLSVDDLRTLNNFLRGWGVSQWVPTLVTNSLDAMENSCRVIAEARRDPLLKRAIPGIHLEGPCISPEDGPRGAHPFEHVRNPNIKDFDRLWRASEGAILYTTLAPELPGAARYIREVCARGCVVSLGHHNANAEQIHAAVEAGARLCTHLGNGMHTTIQRHNNPLWPQLAEDKLMASLIADLHHLPVPVLQTFVRCKGVHNIIIVSDSVNLAGMKPGTYTLFGGKVELLSNGKICIPGTQMLAGSGLMLVQGVFNLAQHTELNLSQAIACATVNPARLLGVKKRGHLPCVGQCANFMVTERKKNGQVKVGAVFIDGKERTTNEHK